ncbi:kinesin-domain-containing protein [Trichodelitschia bisporula]|uniref:Kinesin-domain-containing protein n=1 Tax=Trichodelitschia bisporula TaxID=703511 RepID=A0A6G1I367_9PEZI|nr:kinesin-domain-containing protein [Trichodelitschia bisporula]
MSRYKSPVVRGAAKTRPVSRDDEDESMIVGDETNINVVVRCRGRNEREVRENSGVVVSTEGVKGKTVELAMGTSALSNKTYHFDKVFSPAADQIMIFDEVVMPIMDEVLAGYNCTIFAYGQTGTGKTYTMSGDINAPADLAMSENAGIIPRVLHALFDRLEADENDNSVKCSFIELYNEELRDLLSPDDSVKLKIFEENKKGHISTVVQGMEETYVTSATEGIDRLREGSHKRQVAATKCNDLSSRSHTVFTVTVYRKRLTETGEEFVNAGKLNLVDLAGSENIQRSGAENKRAAEAGLINKSLLTLGRVINALVDKSSHIPYRESKLTRLLQDSLGGRTKTCIIATLSPAKSNLEETISTLDYAFRAKNIRNKPQANQVLSKNTMFREWALEIERLKSELKATRQRNGVYLTPETYEQLTTENESRRILSEEQRDKIETMELHLRNKLQELFSLQTNYHSLKKDHETTKVTLDSTKSALEKTEALLAQTQQSLAEETALRKAYQHTERDLRGVSKNLIGTLGQTTADLDGLHSKLHRRSDLHDLNREEASALKMLVDSAAESIEERLGCVQGDQLTAIAKVHDRVLSFVNCELSQARSSCELLKEQLVAMDGSKICLQVLDQEERAEFRAVARDVEALRGQVRARVTDGLKELESAAQRIQHGIRTEVDSLHQYLHKSSTSLSSTIRDSGSALLNDLGRLLVQARSHTFRVDSKGEMFRDKVLEATRELDSFSRTETERRAAERAELLDTISKLLNETTECQADRLANRLRETQEALGCARTIHESYSNEFRGEAKRWSKDMHSTLRKAVHKGEELIAHCETDLEGATEATDRIRATTSEVHASTKRTIDTQSEELDRQLGALDGISQRVFSISEEKSAARTCEVDAHVNNVRAVFGQIVDKIEDSGNRMNILEADIAVYSDQLKDRALDLAHNPTSVADQLSSLRDNVRAAKYHEYEPAGTSPARKEYPVPDPSRLPRTSLGKHGRTDDDEHSASPSKRRFGSRSPAKSPSKRASPRKALVAEERVNRFGFGGPGEGGLRELDVNAFAAATGTEPLPKMLTTGGVETRKRKKRGGSAGTVGGENEDMPALSASVGPRTGLRRKRS